MVLVVTFMPWPHCCPEESGGPSTHWVGGWVAPSASLAVVENRWVSCPYQELTQFIGHPNILTSASYSWGSSHKCHLNIAKIFRGYGFFNTWKKKSGQLQRHIQKFLDLQCCKGWYVVQLSATRCCSIPIFWVSLVSFAAVTLCVDPSMCLLILKILLWTFQSLPSAKRYIETLSWSFWTYFVNTPMKTSLF